MPGSTKLEQLTEFSQTVIALFHPEAILKVEAQDFIDVRMASLLQQRDLLNGYVYAQEHLLPRFKEGIDAKVTAEEFLAKILTLHGYLSNALLTRSGTPEFIGSYVTTQMAIWDIEDKAQMELYTYFCGLHPCKNDRAFVENFCRKFALDQQQITNFIVLLRKIEKAEFKCSKDSLAGEPTTSNPYILVILKLYAAYNEGKLSKEELETLHPIIKIMMPVDKIPAAMRDYAEKTLARFYRCNPDNLEEISDFLAESFYELTEIHPFANANGRLATCLMNVFLRAFNQPSIVLMRQDKKPYDQLFTHIKTSRAPLKKAIYDEVLAEKIKPLQAQGGANLLNLGLSFCEKMEQLLERKFDIKKFLKDNLIQTLMPQSADMETSLVIILQLVELADHVLCSPVSGVVADVGQFKLPKQEMIASLARISGLSNWKLNRKDGSIILWIEVTGKPADKVVTLITAANIAKQISVKRVDKNPNNWVIQCVDVDPKKLCNAQAGSASSPEETHHAGKK